MGYIGLNAHTDMTMINLYVYKCQFVWDVDDYKSERVSCHLKF